MNQDQQFLVNNLQKMIKYIQQETDRKVANIKKEAGKDADLEKALRINPEKEKISRRMEKELEDYKTQMKIAQSQKMNKLRLEKLKVKIDCVNTVFEEAKSKLIATIKDDKETYKKVLKDLMIQGFIKLLDNDINIICKKEDVGGGFGLTYGCGSFCAGFLVFWRCSGGGIEAVRFVRGLHHFRRGHCGFLGTSGGNA